MIAAPAVGELGFIVAGSGGRTAPALPDRYAQTLPMLLLRFCERFGGWPFEMIDQMPEWQRTVAVEYEVLREQQEAACPPAHSR